MITKNKLILTIALSCLLTACAVSNETPPNMLEPSTPESIESEEYEAVTEGTPPDGFVNYASIIEEYRRFAGYAIEFDDEYYAQVDDLDLWINRGWMGGLIAEAKIGKDMIKEDFCYAIQDLNGNGSPELILAMGDSVVRAIFSTVENKPRLLADFNVAVRDGTILSTFATISYRPYPFLLIHSSLSSPHSTGSGGSNPSSRRRGIRQATTTTTTATS